MLSKNSLDLTKRLDVIKSEFYKRKLDVKFAPKDDKGIIWTIEWSNPKVQTVNDSVSYVFYRFTAQVQREGKLFKAQETGAATYLMVKNEKEFYKAFFYLPPNLRSKNPIDDTPELIMRNFTGKLLLSNLESKKSFLLDYKNGSVSDEYKKNQLSFKKLQSVGSAISYFETVCHYEMAWCTYATYYMSCGGGIIIEYRQECQVPSYCQSSIWILIDSDIQEVCEQVWFPDPPIDPGSSGGDGGDAFDPENPTEDDYELLNTRTDSINIKNKLDCFNNVPSNSNTSYSVKICADIPVNSNPDYYLTVSVQPEPGHVFLELTKTNGSISVTETIGFYPNSQVKATFQGSVESRMFDNEYHEYDASMLKMLNELQFEVMLDAAKAYSKNDYQMTGFNCTQYALDVSNVVGNVQLTIPPSVTYLPLNNGGLPVPVNLGRTPNGVYKKNVDLYNNQGPGASPFSGTGAVSTDCNSY